METNRGQNVNDTIYQFIKDNFPMARQRDFELTDLLIETGIVDSLGLLTLIEFLETTFGIRISDADVTADNFVSVDSIANFVQSLLKEKPQA